MPKQLQLLFWKDTGCWTGSLVPSATVICLCLSHRWARTLLRAEVFPTSHFLTCKNDSPLPTKVPALNVLNHFSSNAFDAENGMCEGVTKKATHESQAIWWHGVTR